MEEKRDGVSWPDHKALPLNEQGTLCVTGPNQVGTFTPRLLRNVALPPTTRDAKNSRCYDHKTRRGSAKQKSDIRARALVCISLYICVCTCPAGSLSKRINVYFCVGLSNSGVGEGPEGFWLQYARGNRVQHGSLHPKTG